MLALPIDIDMLIPVDEDVAAADVVVEDMLAILDMPDMFIVEVMEGGGSMDEGGWCEVVVSTGEGEGGLGNQILYKMSSRERMVEIGGIVLHRCE